MIFLNCTSKVLTENLKSLKIKVHHDSNGCVLITQFLTGIECLNRLILSVLLHMF